MSPDSEFSRWEGCWVARAPAQQFRSRMLLGCSMTGFAQWTLGGAAVSPGMRRQVLSPSRFWINGGFRIIGLSRRVCLNWDRDHRWVVVEYLSISTSQGL
jgi:hypothetical protein